MFVELGESLLSGEKVTFTVERKADGTLRVVYVPTLSGSSEKVSEQLEGIRASLALPVIWSAHPAKLDEHFADMLTTVKGSRQRIANDFEEARARLQEAENAARKNAASIKTKTPADGDKAGSTGTQPGEAKQSEGSSVVVPPPAVSTNKNPESLF